LAPFGKCHSDQKNGNLRKPFGDAVKSLANSRLILMYILNLAGQEMSQRKATAFAVVVVLSLVLFGALAFGVRPASGSNAPSYATYSYSNLTYVGVAYSAVLLNQTTIRANSNTVIHLVFEVNSPVSGNIFFAVAPAWSQVGVGLMERGEVPTAFSGDAGNSSAPSVIQVTTSYPAGMVLHNPAGIMTVVITLHNVGQGTIPFIAQFYQNQPEPSVPGGIDYAGVSVPFQIEVSG
jgi:hypothetical protein